MLALPKEALIIIRDPKRWKIYIVWLQDGKNLDKTTLKIEFSFFLAWKYCLMSTEKLT